MTEIWDLLFIRLHYFEMRFWNFILDLIMYLSDRMTYLFQFKTYNFILLLLQKRSLGSALLEQVLYHLDIIEKDYFGLQYTDPHNVNVSQVKNGDAMGYILLHWKYTFVLQVYHHKGVLLTRTYLGYAKYHWEQSLFCQKYYNLNWLYISKLHWNVHDTSIFLCKINCEMSCWRISKGCK